MEIGAMVSSTKSITEATKGLGQSNIKVHKKDSFILYSWFASKRLAESAVGVSANIIFIVKTNTKGLFQDAIDNLGKYYPGGYYLVLKINFMVPWEISLISVGYNYNCWKGISSVAI